MCNITQVSGLGDGACGVRNGVRKDKACQVIALGWVRSNGRPGHWTWYSESSHRVGKDKACQVIGSLPAFAREGAV